MVKSCYVHVPFCSSICAYCDFQRAGYSEVLCDKWLDALEIEISMKQIPSGLKTMYIGGGTPSCLKSDQLKRLLEILQPYVSAIEEYTMEMNPESCTDDVCALVSAYGVNRVSLGVQSFEPRLLQLMNRHHDEKTIENAIASLHRFGIHNISVDAMYSLPTQTMSEWISTLQKCVSLDVTHLSMYSLTIEPGSAFARQRIKPLDADTEADMYEQAISFLENNGFVQYEISSFCKPGYESRHNTAYWHYNDFIGLGLGASGKENHVRYDHPFGFQNYLNDPSHLEVIELSKQDEMFEMIMMGLRLKEGMSLSLFKERFDCDFDDVYHDVLCHCISKGWLIVEQGKVKATDRGFEILNTVLEEFLI